MNWWKPIIVVAVLLLGGCVAQYVDKAEKLHAIAAHEADIAAAFIVKAACHAPTDALLRWCESTDICRAIYYGCPTVRNLMAAMATAMEAVAPPPVADDAPAPAPSGSQEGVDLIGPK